MMGEEARELLVKSLASGPFPIYNMTRPRGICSKSSSSSEMLLKQQFLVYMTDVKSESACRRVVNHTHGQILKTGVAIMVEMKLIMNIYLDSWLLNLKKLLTDTPYTCTFLQCIPFPSGAL